ncbi:MAG: DUF433 domain-containing protein [Bacteroidota bacterium]
MGEARVRGTPPVRPVMKQQQVYHSDPEILGGTPVFIGTRVPVQNLLDYLAAGRPLGDFLEGFPSVSREQAVAFLALAKDAVLAAA